MTTEERKTDTEGLTQETGLRDATGNTTVLVKKGTAVVGPGGRFSSFMINFSMH